MQQTGPPCVHAWGHTRSHIGLRHRQVEYTPLEEAYVLLDGAQRWPRMSPRSTEESYRSHHQTTLTSPMPALSQTQPILEAPYTSFPRRTAANGCPRAVTSTTTSPQMRARSTYMVTQDRTWLSIPYSTTTMQVRTYNPVLRYSTT